MTRKLKVYKSNESVLENNETELSEGLAVTSLLHPQLPSPDAFSEALKSFKLDQATNRSSFKDELNILQAYGSIYQKVTTSMQQRIKAVDGGRNFYLAEMILSQITEDALTPEIGTDEILSIKYPKDKKIEKILQKMEKDLNIDQLILDITPDMLAYGEYYLRPDFGEKISFQDKLAGATFTKVTGTGIKALRDSVEQGTIVQLSQDAENRGYLVLEERGRIVKTPSNFFVKFSLGGSRVRVRLDEQAPFAASNAPKVKKLLEDLPRFIRIGKSYLYPYLSKLKELELLEKLVPATKLSKLSNVNLIGVQVPPKYDVQQGLETAKRVENIINNKVGINKEIGELTVESVLSLAGRSKVVPLFGEKGGLEKMDFKSDEPDDLLSSVNDTRAVILDSMGLPFELFYKNDGQNKGEILKRYARYLRRLKSVQRALCDGIKQICTIHCESLGVEGFDEDEVVVEFLNKLIEIDNLDKLEHADVTVSLLGNIKDFFDRLTEPDSPYREHVDLSSVAIYLDRNLRTIGLPDAIKTDKNGKVKIVLDDEDNTDVPDASKLIRKTPDLEPEDDMGQEDDEDEVEPENETLSHDELIRLMENKIAELKALKGVK
jgi:hypothetical protein